MVAAEVPLAVEVSSTSEPPSDSAVVPVFVLQAGALPARPFGVESVLAGGPPQGGAKLIVGAWVSACVAAKSKAY